MLPWCQSVREFSKCGRGVEQQRIWEWRATRSSRRPSDAKKGTDHDALSKGLVETYPHEREGCTRRSKGCDSGSCCCYHCHPPRQRPFRLMSGSSRVTIIEGDGGGRR